MNPTVVSYYTPKYAEYASRLMLSCEEFGVPHQVVLAEDHGCWLDNVRIKPIFLSAALEEIDGPVFWVDSDAEFVSQIPQGFINAFTKSVAFRVRDGEFLSGTIWLNNDEKAREWLFDWAFNLDQDPNAWDQQGMPDIRDSALFAPLDTRWCCIDGLDECEDPIIVHHQASRELRDDSWHRRFRIVAP